MHRILLQIRPSECAVDTAGSSPDPTGRRRRYGIDRPVAHGHGRIVNIFESAAGGPSAGRQPDVVAFASGGSKDARLRAAAGSGDGTAPGGGAVV
jgi:hypothetical protein